VPVTHHSGSSPDYGPYPEAKVMFLLEVTWWAHRTLWHLIFAKCSGTIRACRWCSPGRGPPGCRAAATLDYYHRHAYRPRRARTGQPVSQSRSSGPR
jgi:hypothetical protein